MPTTKHAPEKATRPGKDASEEEYCARALAAYFREMTRLERQGVSMKQPSDGATSLETLAGKSYITVANSYEMLAVYRIGNNGLLRRLRRWPKALAAAAGFAD